MNWEAIGAVGEMIGALGVIITLVYLSVQVNQNSKRIRASTRQEVSNTAIELGLGIAGNPMLRTATKHLLTGTEPGNIDDELSLDFFFRATMRFFENIYHQHQDGTFGDEMWGGYSHNIKLSLQSEVAQGLWQKHKLLYGSDFISFIESEIIGKS